MTHKHRSYPLSNASVMPATSPMNHGRIHYTRDSMVKKAGCVGEGIRFRYGV